MSVSRHLTCHHQVDSTDALVEEITKETTRWALKLFNDFCHEASISVEFTSQNIPALVQVLKRLYSDEKVKKYDKISTFPSLRFALKRHFLETLKVDIIEDEAFMEANKAFTAMENHIKAVILKQKLTLFQEKDLELLREYFENNMQDPTPEQLLEYIWFILQYYKRQLGPGSYDNLTMNRFIIRTDAEGKQYILPNEYEPLLSSCENSSAKKSFFSNLIPAMKGDVLCPVRAFKLYKSKIHKDLDKFFQKPKEHIDPQQECWFYRTYLSRSSQREMMTTLSQNANLSTIYENQSLTGATIAKLIWGKHLGKDIQSNSKSSNHGEKNTTTRQVKVKPSISIVKKKKRGRPRNYDTTSIYKNEVAESLNQENSSVSNPPLIINITKDSQQQGVKLPSNKSVPNVSSVNKAPSPPIAAPSHRHVLPSPKQPFSKSETSSNNSKQLEILTSIKTERDEESTVIVQNIWTPRTSKVVSGRSQESPSSVNVQIDKNREPSSRSTFMITDVRSCDSLFTEENVAKTIVKSVETQIHSYVIHNHQSSMLANMAELWKKGKFCDATIGNGTMKIMVHKIVLLALSPQLLDSSNSDLTSECFQFHFPQEIGGDALWAFSKYMYEGVVSLNSGVLEDMERISSILNLQDLKDTCNLYRKQVNLSIKTSQSSQSLPINHLTPADDIAINLDPLSTSIKSEASPSGATIKSEASQSVATIQSEASQSVATIQSEASPSVATIQSEASPSVATIQSEASPSVATIQSEASPSVATIQSKASPSVATIQSEASPSVATIQSEASPSVATIKSEASPSVATIQSEASPSGTTIKSEASPSVATIQSEASPSVATIKSEASPSVATIQSEASPSGTTIKSEASQSVATIKSKASQSVATIKSEASPSVATIQSEASPSGTTIKSKASQSVATIKSEASQSIAAIQSEMSPIRATIKSETSQSEVSVVSLSSGDVTQILSRPVQHLQIMEPESNSPRLEYSSNQSSIGGVNRVIDDRSCVTISGSDSDSDLTVVSSNIKQNPVRKRRRRHMENNFLQSRQPESFLNDNIHESWPPHSYNGKDNLTNPSQSKQMKLSDNLVIDNSQNFKISYASANQRSNDLPYSRIGDSDESS